MKKMYRKKIPRACLFLLTLSFFSVFAQEGVTLKQLDSIVEVKIKLREKQQEEKFGKISKVRLFGMMQTRYLNGLVSDVDYSGKQNSDQSKVVSNTFDIKRFRLGGKFNVSEKIEAGFLANFADFKSDPKNKFLENAFVKYKHNKYLNFTAGQFRPLFGLEDSYGVDVIRSFDYSNLYYETGLNGWQSFQIGASISGETAIGKKTLFYGTSVVNGNGRNVLSDSSNEKLYSGRLQLELSKKHNFRIGWSGGVGKEFNQQTYVIGADIKGNMGLSKNLVLELQAEVRQGVNHSLFGKLPAADQFLYTMESYQMRGGYFLPNIRYFLNKKYLNMMEFSCRYEYWDSNFKLNSNVRQSYTPMVSLENLKEYACRVSTGVQIDNYEANIADTKTYDNKLFILQLQVRF